MVLGLKGRLDQVARRQDPASRFADIACQFWVAERVDGALLWTARHSQVYGGRWDTWCREYVGEADDILYIPCSAEQFEFVESDDEIVEGAGGRGSGKSEAGIRKVCRKVCELPMEWGRAVSPGPDQKREMWGKALDLFLDGTNWLWPGLMGVKESISELWFKNGVRVQFISAHKPQKLRSWGGSWAMVDEAQAVTTEALDILWPCLRDGGDHPQMFQQLTPAPGEPLERHDLYKEDPSATTIVFDSYSNVFVDHTTFERSKFRMSKDREAIEIGADWETVRRLAAADELKPVFPFFNRAIHKWRPTEDDFGKDITGRVAHGKLGKLRGYNWKFIAGVDPNGSVPNYCTIWKVFAPRKGEVVNRWVMWDVIWSKGHCGHLATVVKDQGYHPNDVVIVPDFSSRYNKLGNPKASSALMRQEGFHVVNRPKNPDVKGSIEDMSSKLDPARGMPTMFLRLPQCDVVAENLEVVVWDKYGNGFDKSIRPDPVDSARYPVSFFAPAAKLVNQGIRGFVMR